jgi:dTDP-glucose pyrophosphorylase/predicted transcriptional regulator
MKNKIEKHLINNLSPLSKALLRMDKYGFKTLIVTDKFKNYLGTLTDGDVRRAIISKKNLSDRIDKIYKKKTIFFFKKDFSIKKAKTLLAKHKIEIIPVINKSKKISKIISYRNLINKTKSRKKKGKKIFGLSVIIMAGGKGTRLLPYTKVLPKPLIPIGNKTLIEHVISQFTYHRINNFIFTINYKALIFKAFFKELNPNFNYTFLEEKRPLGTAGSLSQIKANTTKNFIISTCDTVIRVDYYKVFKFHLENNNDITIIAANISKKVPYGVLKYGKMNQLVEFKEKPVLKHTINTGIYVVNHKIFSLIPRNKIFNMNDLIFKASKLGKNIALFKIPEKDWTDYGKLTSFEGK